MAKNWKWYASDVLTRVGCGALGGATVFLIDSNSFGEYWILLAIGLAITGLGYVFGLEDDKHSPKE
jgi:hypothetical protein